MEARSKAMTKTKIPTVLVLRTCQSNLQSYRGFQWPSSGRVIAPDWDPTPTCGKGLHGLLRGVGDGDLLNWDPSAKWLVVRVRTSEIVDLTNKVKFPRGTVVYCGDRKTATDLLVAKYPNTPIVGCFVTGGAYATVTGGAYAKVTGGAGATVTGGVGATVTGGVGATVTGGAGATVTGGAGATVTGGVYAKVTGGDRATVTGGAYATVTGGVGATLQLSYWDGNRTRIVVSYIGEDGIQPDVVYRLNSAHVFEATAP